MVPQPVWTERPTTPAYHVDASVTSGAEAPAPEAKLTTNVSGRPWKDTPKSATNRKQSGQKSKEQLSAAWAKRDEQRKKLAAVKALEREMKDEKQAEIDRKREITKERQLKAAEKLRLEEMAKRMSAKKLQRMQKRLGRTKKVAH